MGLFRLFWIPPGGGPADGAYVRYRGDELLAVLAVESVRAGAVVVGEDLGTVEPEVRTVLADAGLLSYRLAWFEDGPPEDYPRQALAAVTTHDLPTVAGVWSGDDAADQRAAGIEPDEPALERLRGRLMGLTGLGPDAPSTRWSWRPTAASPPRPAPWWAPRSRTPSRCGGAPTCRAPPTSARTGRPRCPLPLGEVFSDPLVSRVVDALHRP